MPITKPVTMYQARTVTRRNGPFETGFCDTKDEAVTAGRVLFGRARFKVLKITTQVFGFYGGQNE